MEFAVPERIALDGMVLRRALVSDATALFEAYARDPEATRFLAIRTVAAVEHTQEFLVRCQRDWDAGHTFVFAMTLPDDDRPFGAIDLRIEGFQANYGYALARSHWGRGFASTALKALVDLALVQPGVWRAWAFCDAGNPASGRVMEKAGMSFEGRLRRWHIAPNVSGEPRDCLAYAKVR